MLKGLVQYLRQMGEEQADLKSKMINIDGVEYTTASLSRVHKKEVPSAIRISTLQGLIDYLKLGIDDHNQVDDALIIHIHDSRNISLYTQLDQDLDRFTYINCQAVLPEIRYDYMDIERFNVQLQSCFVPTDEVKAVLKVTGNIKEGTLREASDDGVSQAITVKKGIQMAQDATVPNPVNLAPFRTFSEVPQPESKFVLRLKDGPSGALIEADGGAWRIEAMDNIKKYLAEKLQGLNVKIIS